MKPPVAVIMAAPQDAAIIGDFADVELDPSCCSGGVGRALVEAAVAFGRLPKSIWDVGAPSFPDGKGSSISKIESVARKLAPDWN